MTHALLYDEITSPIGKVLIATLDDQLVALDFADYTERMHQLLMRRFGPFTLTRKRNPAGIATQVRQYFDGDLHAFDNVPFAMHGSPFQERAWQALRTIPPGTVATYAEQATRIGAESDSDRHSLSSRDRRQSLTYRLCRRSRPQALAPRA